MSQIRPFGRQTCKTECEHFQISDFTRNDRSANSHLSNLVLHGDILQGKKEVLQNSGIQQIFMAKPKKDELESFHLYI